MRTVLEDLWYGNIDPHVAILAEDRHCKSRLALMGKNRDGLSSTSSISKKVARKV